MESNKDNKFYITEIINDLERYGYVRGGKAYIMLHDWAAELREKSRTSFPMSRLKKQFAKEVGIKNW